jgi:hypothetical protein
MRITSRSQATWQGTEATHAAATRAASVSSSASGSSAAAARHKRSALFRPCEYAHNPREEGMARCTRTPVAVVRGHVGVRPLRHRRRHLPPHPPLSVPVHERASRFCTQKHSGVRHCMSLRVHARARGRRWHRPETQRQRKSCCCCSYSWALEGSIGRSRRTAAERLRWPMLATLTQTHGSRRAHGPAPTHAPSPQPVLPADAVLVVRLFHCHWRALL